MKRKSFLGVLVAAAFLALNAVTVLASDARVLLDGYFLEADAVIVDGRTLLPVRALGEAVGAEVGWDGDTRQVTLYHGQTIILLTIDSHMAYINGEVVYLDVPAQLFNGSTFLPLRFIAESLGLGVQWMPDPATAILRSPASAFTDQQLAEIALTGAITPTPQEPPAAASTSLFSGTFTVGRDIPVGRYVVTTSDSRGNFIVHNSDGRLHINETFNNFVSVTADFGEGYTIEIRNNSDVVFTPAVRSLSNRLTTGHWVVGVDIAAGTFDAVPASNTGNFIIHNANGRLAVNEVFSRTDRVRVSLVDGQTIRISSVEYVDFVTP